MGFPLRPTGGGEHEETIGGEEHAERVEDLHSSQRIRDNLLEYHLAPGLLTLFGMKIECAATTKLNGH